GQQEFSEIRLQNLMYVDKTPYIYELLKRQVPFFFLSRPRRFGKSLLINTLKELFLGKKEFFEGLFIYDKIDWQFFPVIHIDCSKLPFRTDGLEKALSMRIKLIAKSYQVKLYAKSIGTLFEELIYKLQEKYQQKVVILIDEYDKPITDVLEIGENQQAHENRDILRSFYGIVKGSSAHIRFFFLTGITRFSKVSLFSELNNLVDISFHKDFHNLLGYTPQEITQYFTPHLRAISSETGKSLEEIWQQIQFWYNGYSWNGRDKLYNPFSVLCFLDAREIRNFWFESGTPKMLVELLRKEWVYDLRNLKATFALINNFDIDKLNLETLLFQTGYLTISEIDKFDRYILNYPNKEVEQSLLQYLLADYSQAPKNVALSYEIITAIENNDISYLCQVLNQLFA
ncbi:MAG: AAA family ATPase, partial [Raineya sp.]|nr:AAA family ATPase [Raineya sp.]